MLWAVGFGFQVAYRRRLRIYMACSHNVQDLRFQIHSEMYGLPCGPENFVFRARVRVTHRPLSSSFLWFIFRIL